jgi:putative ABC transport system permease protein
MSGRLGLWFRWSWRDLRARWHQVFAIALIIAIGSGVYAGLSSNTVWRRANYDDSYEALASHHATIKTASGTFAEEGQLRSVIDAMEHPDWVTVAEERLVVPTQVDASEAAGETLLVPGRIVGVDTEDGGPHVDQLEVVDGRGLAVDDAGEPTVLLDSHFVEHHELPETGSIEVSGGRVDYVGSGYSPETFVVAAGQGSFLAEAGFAVMFSSLETAQQLAGTEGQVNELAVRFADGVDGPAAVEELTAALEVAAPDLAAEVEWLQEERIYRRLYDDIESDQKLFNIFAGLILGGAAFAAFNLTSRIVEAQRREIGIGMALGLDSWKIAVRPLLVGLQIALLGAAVGVLFGLWVGALISDLNVQFFPLPVWENDFQAGVFLRGAALVVGLVLLATVFPVVRAVRVDPVDAIQTRRTLGKGGGLAPALRRIPLPGNSVHQFPFRNVVREPRRTLLTVLGIGAAIAVLIGLIGMIDSFLETIDGGQAEIVGDSPDRATVTLDFFYPDDAEQVRAIEATPGVAEAEPQLIVGGAFVDDSGEDIETLVSLIDFDSELWVPSTVEGSLDADEPSLVISQKAADDLGVEPGDTVTFRHPRREGLGYSLVESELPISAIHPNPYRFVVYMDRADASVMNLEGIVNAVSVVPDDGTSLSELKESLFGKPAVASVEGVTEVANTIRESIDDFLGILRVIEGFVLLMALLIAFNTTSISSDERRREHATMFAFGLSTRSVMSLIVVESLLLGIMGTFAGVIAGRLLLAWMIQSLLPTTVPDVGVTVDVATSTYLTAAVLGVIAVAAAPLLTLRRLQRMDVPATLRVVE